jgi:hypothetical protein
MNRGRLFATQNRFEAQIATVNDAVTAEFQPEIVELVDRVASVLEQLGGVKEQAYDVFTRMQRRLDEEQPVFKPSEIEFEADEDDNPLFDSRRSYLDQLASYKRFRERTRSCPAVAMPMPIRSIVANFGKSPTPHARRGARLVRACENGETP